MRFTRNQKLAMSSVYLVAALLAAGIYLAIDGYYGKVEPGANMDIPVTVVTQRVPVEILPQLPPGADTYRKSDADLQSSNLSELPSELSTNHLDNTNVRDDWNLGGDNDFPEHLKCPDKWVGVYLSDLSESELFEVLEHTDAVAKEIVQNHNLNRPFRRYGPNLLQWNKTC